MPAAAGDLRSIGRRSRLIAGCGEESGDAQVDTS